jgi:Ca2+-binding EF-hand superfamily protein
MAEDAPIEWQRAFSFIVGDATGVIDCSKLVAAYARVGVHVSTDEAQQMLLAFCGESQCT